QGLGNVRLGQGAATDLTLEVVFDRLHRSFELLLGDIVQVNVDICERHDMGNSVAHASCANHTYFFYHRLFPAIKVSAIIPPKPDPYLHYRAASNSGSTLNRSATRP